MALGTYPGLDMAAYQSAAGVSSSALRTFARSPAHYRAAYLLGLREPPSRAMEIGTALHRLIESPERFEAEYCIRPNSLDGRTKDGKAWAAEQNGKTALTESEFADLTCMAANVRQHSRIMRVLAKGQPELSVFWTDSESGLQCKARADWRNEPLSLLVDFKSTDDARPEAFRRSIARFGYDCQAAHYLAGFNAAAWLWVAVERNPPYAVAAYMASQDLLARAEQARRQFLDRLAECQAADDWPAYPHEITEIGD